MGALYTILGIILFFVILFSVHLHIIVDYGEKTVIYIKYLFLKIPLVDTSKPKKEKKPKKKKEKKNKDDATEEAPAEDTSADKKKEKPAKQGNGLLKQLYIDQGYDGIERMLRALGKSLNGFFGKLYKTVVFDELYITMITSGGDAADTALKYGRLCSWLYPILGKLVSTSKVKKYDFDISPDFLATKDQAELYADLYVTPIHITNGVIVLAVQLLFKVLFKVLFAKKKSDKSKAVIKTEEAAQTDSAVTDVNDIKNETNIN